MSTKTTTLEGNAVVIPAELRDRFGLVDGSVLVIEARSDGIVLRPVDDAGHETTNSDRNRDIRQIGALARADAPPMPAESQQLSDQLARFPEIVRFGERIYTPEGLRQFLITPLPRFDGQTALQLMKQGQIGEVISALAADYEGLS